MNTLLPLKDYFSIDYITALCFLYYICFHAIILPLVLIGKLFGYFDNIIYFKKNISLIQKETLLNEIDQKIQSLENFALSEECQAYNKFLEESQNLKETTLKNLEIEQQNLKVRLLGNFPCEVVLNSAIGDKI